MVSWWVPYLAKGQGLTSIMVQGITRTVAAFRGPGVSLSPTRIIHLFRSPTYGLLVGAISGQRPPDPTSIMTQVITRILAAFLPPPAFFESNSYIGPSPGHSNLGTLKKITTACTIAALLMSLFSPPKCSEASFKRAQSVNKNCLKDATSMLYT